jgi:hypothetical protein
MFPRQTKSTRVGISFTLSDTVLRRSGLRNGKIRIVAHHVLVGLFSSAAAAGEAARALHSLGIGRDALSVVARDHEEARALADRMDATPGAELEDSRVAGRLGELAGRIAAAVAIVLPGIGPIVAGGPLAAELGEAAGHAAGSLESVLKHAGVPADRAEALQQQVAAGEVLLGVHVAPADVDRVRAALQAAGASQVDQANWA